MSRVLVFIILRLQNIRPFLVSHVMVTWGPKDSITLPYSLALLKRLVNCNACAFHTTNLDMDRASRRPLNGDRCGRRRCSRRPPLIRLVAKWQLRSSTWPRCQLRFGCHARAHAHQVTFVIVRGGTQWRKWLKHAGAKMGFLPVSL